MRRLLRSLGVMLALVIQSFWVAAQTPQTEEFPQRTISMIVPFAVGSASDLTLRLIADFMSTELGKPVVVENVSGASGLIGIERARRAAPDGYTIVGLSDTLLIYLPLLVKSAKFDPMKDFDLLSVAAEAEWVLVTHPSYPARSLQELIRTVQASPQKPTYSSGGHGSPQHVAMAYLESRTGISLIQVPYKGATPAMMGVAAGDVPMMLVSIAPSLQLIKDGRLRAIATLGPARSELLPNIPTVDESGLAGFEFSSWVALGIPAGVPPRRAAILQRAMQNAVADPTIRGKLLAAGLKPIGSSTTDANKRLAADNRKLGALVHSIGLKPE